MNNPGSSSIQKNLFANLLSNTNKQKQLIGPTNKIAYNDTGFCDSNLLDHLKKQDVASGLNLDQQH